MAQLRYLIYGGQHEFLSARGLRPVQDVFAVVWDIWQHKGFIGCSSRLKEEAEMLIMQFEIYHVSKAYKYCLNRPPSWRQTSQRAKIRLDFWCSPKNFYKSMRELQQGSFYVVKKVKSCGRVAI
jgi:hypothetical protein